MLSEELYAELCKLPVIDVHSHLDPRRLPAPVAEKVLGYHMVLYPLRAAGADETKLWSRDGPHERFVAEEFLKAWPAASKTGFGWALRTILRELFGFEGPVTEGNLPDLMAAMNAAAARKGRAEEILAKGNVVRILSSLPPVPSDGGAGAVFRYTIETGEGMTAKDHLTWPERMRMLLRGVGAEPGSLTELDEAYAELLRREDWTDRRAFVRWVTGQADLRPVPGRRLEDLMRRAASSDAVTREETCILNAAAIRAMLRAASSHTKTFQLCFGAQRCVPGPGHPIQSLAPEFASSLGYLFAEFPDAHFNILNGYEAAEPVLCSHCLAYGNVSLGGFWWHMFYPAAMHAAWHRRLDMVPATRLSGFFSDGYCLEWQFGRLRMTQRVLANVLAERIERGFCNAEEAVEIARAVLEGTPKDIFLPDE
jgi:glucuronate isomerase